MLEINAKGRRDRSIFTRQSLRELALPPDDASHAVLFLKIASKSRLAVSTTIWVRLTTLSFRRMAADVGFHGRLAQCPVHRRFVCWKCPWRTSCNTLISHRVKLQTRAAMLSEAVALPTARRASVRQAARARSQWRPAEPLRWLQGGRTLAQSLAHSRPRRAPSLSRQSSHRRGR